MKQRVMKQYKRNGGTESILRQGSWTYWIEAKPGEVLLYGGERKQGKAVVCSCLSFSEKQLCTVKAFAKELASSETHPCMMPELAEEYFSSAKPAKSFIE